MKYLSQKTGNPVLIILALLGAIFFVGSMASVGGYTLMKLGAKDVTTVLFTVLGLAVTVFNLIVFGEVVVTGDQKLVENDAYGFVTKLLWLIEALVVAIGATTIGIYFFNLPWIIAGVVAVALCVVVGAWRYWWNWGEVKVEPQPGD